MPHESPSGKISPVASIFDVASDSLRKFTDRGPWLRMSESDKAESPVCDVQVDESTDRCAEEYSAVKVESQEKASASVPRLALINDVAFRTLSFRALIVYMYTKEATFIPLKSSGGRSYNVGDACSPRSMYRLGNCLQWRDYTL
ncbi:hypothetical protein ARMSODRAFT_958478 [Armillaria solidipes]|uniref:Uncharacterized protein n=1 Tax=Armillaria solidipes TaxID=1076256 RepID=A0A2H3BVH1_9AGAR|nr:hypothetical protein ARMSODRAFT_958478 [Armillaria solidipes]